MNMIIVSAQKRLQNVNSWSWVSFVAGNDVITYMKSMEP